MDEELYFLPNKSGKRLANGGDDRISALPNEILLLILSFLPVRKAASTTLLSSRWLGLWRQIPNLKFNLESDRISQLPDQIISVILSFLPLKKAAATSVLSSRWSDSWKHTPNLNFNHDIVPDSIRMEGETYKYIEIVNSVLQSHKAVSLKQFRICFLCIDKSAKRAVTKWLEFVFLRKVESLELVFLCYEYSHMVVLGELLREISTICGDPQTLIFFQSLKSLRLFSLVVSGEDIELFLRNCPLLEQLIIRFVCLTSDIEVCGPLLKHLEIYHCRGGGKSIKVSVPSLAFIKFSDGVGKLLLENVPRLVEAAFDINTSEFVMHHFASAASFHISQLQILNIDLTHLKVFWTNAFPEMPNLKKLSITCFELYNHCLLPVTRVIWASPRLEEFKLQFVGSREEQTAYMKEMDNVGRSPHQHLKVFHLYWPHNAQGVRDHAVELVTYVSNNCIALHRINMSYVPDYPLQSQVPNHVQLSIKSWYIV